MATYSSSSRTALSIISTSLRWSVQRRTFTAGRALYQQASTSSTSAPTAPSSTASTKSSSTSSPTLPPSVAELMGQPPQPHVDLLSTLHSTFSAHITPTEVSTSTSDWWSSRSPLNSLQSLQSPGTPQSGRSVPVRGGDIAQAYRALSGRLSRNKIKKELREGEFYEKPSDKNRRLEMERHRRRFQELVS